jgi:hypothetical protein
LHILNNKHDFGIAKETLKLLKPCHNVEWIAGKPFTCSCSTNTAH